MNSTAKTIFSILGALVALIALGWVLHFNQLMHFKVFAPATEAARRDTFEQSKAFRDGVIQELTSMQFEYIQAADTHKAALANVIKHKATQMPLEQMPPELQTFIRGLP